MRSFIIESFWVYLDWFFCGWVLGRIFVFVADLLELYWEILGVYGVLLELIDFFVFWLWASLYCAEYEDAID